VVADVVIKISSLMPVFETVGETITMVWNTVKEVTV